LITPSRNSAEFTLRLSSCRFHERYCWPNPRQQKALENINVFKGLMSGCGDTQPPIPTLADGGYLTGHPCYFVVIRFLKKERRYEDGALGAPTTTLQEIEITHLFRQL